MIAAGKPLILLSALERSSQHTGHALRAKLRQDTLYIGVEVHTVETVSNCSFNGLSASHIRLIGGTKSIQLPMFPGIFAGVLIERDSAGSLPLGLQQTVSQRFNALPHNIHVAFPFTKIAVDICQRRLGFQQRCRLRC